MSNLKITRLALLALAAVAGAASAQSPRAGVSYLDELAKKDAQLVLLRKEIELRDARQLLAGGPSGLPLVSSVSGFESDLTATLTYPNGRKVTVRRGQQLPGGVQVREVSRAGVVVRVAAIEAALEFDSGREVRSGGAQERTPTHLLPPIPQVNVPLPASLMPPVPAGGPAAAPVPVPTTGAAATPAAQTTAAAGK